MGVEYIALCKERVARTSTWDMSDRGNRRELRQAKRYLRQAQYGRYVAAVIGSLIGTSIGLGIYYLVHSWGWM